MADDIEVGTLRAKIETDDTGIKGTLDGLTRQLKVVQSEFAATSAKLGAFATAEQVAQTKADSLNKQMEIQQQKVALLSSKHAESVTKVGENSKATQDLAIKLNNAQTALFKMENELTKSNSGMNKMQEEVKSTTGTLDKQSTSVRNLSKTVNDSNEKMKSSFMSLGQTIKTSLVFGGVYLAINEVKKGIDAVVGGGISFDSTMQNLTIGFTTMLNSASAAKTMLTQLSDFAQATPFDLTGVTTSAKQLLAMGFAAKDVLPDMKAIGDAASGLGLDTSGFQRIALALGQMKTAGQVHAQDMNQLVNNSIPAWEILAKAMGKTVPELRKMVEQGLVPAGKATQDLIDGMEQRFPNMLAKMNSSFSSQMGNIKDAFNRTFGALMLPVFKDLTDNILPKVGLLLNNFRITLEQAGAVAAFKTIVPPNVVDGIITFGKVVKDTFNFIKDNGAAIAKLTGAIAASFIAFKTLSGVVSIFEAIKKATKEVTLLQAAWNLVMSANPFILIGTAIVGIGVLIYENWSKVKSFLVTFWNWLKGFMDSWGGILLTILLPFFGIPLQIAAHWSQVKDFFIKLWSDVKLIFLDMAVYVVDKISKITDLIPGLGTKVDNLKKSLNAMIQETKDTQGARDMASALDGITTAADKAATAATNAKKAFDFKTAGQSADNSPFPLTPFAKFALGIGGYKPPVPTTTTDDEGGGGGTPKTPEQLRKEAYDAALATAKFNAEFLNQSVADQIAALNKVAAAHKQHLKEDIEDERAMQLDIKKLNEDAVKQGQDAITAKFNASKQWISDQKDMNQLSAADEIAAWQRVASRYKDGSAEKIEADKNYYSLKSAMDKQAAADKLAADKKAKDDEVSSLNDLGSAIETALKAQYADEQRIEVEANQKSVDDEQAASQARMDVYQTEHDNKIALLESTSNAQTAALQAQIDAIDAQTKAEDAATKEAAYQAQLVADQVKINAIDNSKQIADAKQKLIDATQQQQFRTIDAQAEYAESVRNDNSPENQVNAQRILNQKLLGLSQDVATAQSQLNAQTDADNVQKAAAQKDMADLVAQHDRDILLAQREARKTALQQQITAIQAAEQVAKTSIDNELKTKQTAETLSLKATTDRLANEKTAIDAHYAALTTEEALQAKARTLALDTNNKELITLLSTYNPQWQNAGQSFGDSLLAGLNSTKTSIQTAIGEMLAMVHSAPTVQAGLYAGQGLANGLTVGASAVTNAAKGLTTGLIGAMNFALGIHSPSKVTTEIGEFTGKGLVNGLGNTLTNIKQMAARVATAAIPQTNSMGGIAIAGGSSGGGGGQQNYYSYGDVYINAKDLAEVKSVSDLFNRLKQAARAK